jgi:hypothetical protein
MANQTMRRDVELQLIEKAWKEDAFRQALRSDPRGAVEKALAAKLPAGLQVKLIEETADTCYLVLPANPDRAPSGQLSDKELDAVAGGWSAQSDGCSCDNCGTGTQNLCVTCECK